MEEVTMSNKIRYFMKEKVAEIVPLLHETYMRIGRFQKKRSSRNGTILRECLSEIGPALQKFKQMVQTPKQQYFDVILMENLDISDRIIALDTAIGAMHIEFSSAQQRYMHRESVELRRALDECRLMDDTPKPIAQRGEDESIICRGLPASPGIVSGQVFLWNSSISFEAIPRRCILVARMTRPEIAVCFEDIDAIVTDMGGTLCHAAILAREKNVPCIVGTGNATALLSMRMEVFVDGGTGYVYSA